MANVKITDLSAHTNPAATDVLPIVDVGADVTKKVSIQDLMENAGSGTAAAPGIAFDGDPNTGIYRPDADQLALSTNGTGRLFINSSGNVGIGTSSPSSRLHVSDSSAGMIRTNRTSDERNHIALGTQDTIRGYIGATSSNCFEVSDSSGASKVTITNGGSVGIGTTSVNYLVHAASAVSSGADVGFRMQDTTNSKIVQLMRTGSSYSSIGIGGTEGVVYSDNTLSLAADNSNPIKFCAGGGEAARIDSSGRLLIGTSSSRNTWFNTGSWGNPALQIETAVATTSIASIVNNSNDDGPGALFLAKSRSGSVGGVTVVSNSDAIGRISFQGADGTEMVAAAQIEAFVDGTPGANDMPGRLVFSTTESGNSSPTERMRIDKAGKTSVIRGGTTEGDEAFSAGSASTSSLRVFTVTQTGNSTAAAALWVRKNSSTNRSINAAGTINAFGADYAEYMSKSGDFIIAKGDVCGVDSSGNLTKTFSEAVGFLVKSTNPSYVGGDTWGAKFDGDPDGLEAARQKVDRIAFAGQVPVNVMGATPGQYIVPVEAAGGGIEGIAKDEADLTLAEYMRAVGKVIAIEDDGRARIIVKVA